MATSVETPTRNDVLAEQRGELGRVRAPELRAALTARPPAAAPRVASRSGSSSARTRGSLRSRDRRRRVERGEHAVGEHADPRGQRERLRHVVRDDDDRLAHLLPGCAGTRGAARARVTGSSAPNGSSISRIGGSAASARATPTRCRCPPESSSGRRVRELAGRQADQRRAARRRARRCAPSSQPSSRGTTAMLSRDGHVRKEADVLQHVADAPPQLERIPRRRAARPSTSDLAGIRQRAGG